MAPGQPNEAAQELQQLEVSWCHGGSGGMAAGRVGGNSPRMASWRGRRWVPQTDRPPSPPAPCAFLSVLQGEAARLRTVLEETAVQLRSAERRLDNMRLARICAAGHDVQAAQVLLAALHPA